MVASVTIELQSILNALENAQKGPNKTPVTVDEPTIEKQLDSAITQVQDVNSMLAGIPAANLQEFFAENDKQLQQIQQSDLNIIVKPYMWLGFVVLGVMVLFIIVKLPKTKGEDDNKINLRPTLKRLFANKKYLEGVVAQAFYVGAQIMVWTFIIQYAELELGIAKEYGQMFNVLAMIIFVTSRFICTFLLKYFSPGGLLLGLASGGFLLVLGTIFLQGNPNAGVEIQKYVDQYVQTGGMFTKFFSQLKGLVIGAVKVDGLRNLYCLIGVSSLYVFDVPNHLWYRP